MTTIGTMSYLYDAFNRLRSWTQAQPNGAYATTTLGYDGFGNQLYSVSQGCGPAGGHCYAGLPANRSVVGSTNHYRDLQYDQAGNVIADAVGRTFTYDPFNRTTSSAVSGRELRYVYGPDEERIALVERVATSGGIRNRTTWTLRGFAQQLLTSWRDDATTGTRVWSWTEDEIWRGSSVLASVSASGTKHYTVDHLGSPRLITGAAGQVLGVQVFDPFGGGGTSDGGFLQFTGHERDAAIVGGSADLPDHFHARQYDRWGRFLSVDPSPQSVDPGAPQTWNRYTYVLNRPLTLIDPYGLKPCMVKGSDGKEHPGECIDVVAPRPRFSFFSWPQLPALRNWAANRAEPKTPPQTPAQPPNKAQCQQLNALLAAESQHGTAGAAARASNTVGGYQLPAFFNDAGARLSKTAVERGSWSTAESP